MKNIISLLAIILIVSAIPQSAKAYDFSAVSPSGHVLYYNITTSNWVEVAPQNSQTPRYSNLSGDLIIPEKVSYNGQEYEVTAVGERALLGCDKVLTISLPESILFIKDYAFWGCSNLTEIIIPSSVTSIGKYSFGRCFSLKKLVIPNDVITIGEKAFMYVSNVEYNGNASTYKPWGAQKINGVVQNGTQSTSGSSTTNAHSTSSNNSQSSTIGNSASARQKRSESPRVGSQNNNAKISRIELTEQYIIVHLLVPSSTDKKAVYRVSSGTIIIPDLPEYVDAVNESLDEPFYLDEGDLLEMAKTLAMNTNNPYFTRDIVNASKKLIENSNEMRKVYKKLGLLIVGAGNEKMDTEYLLYSKEPTSWHFTMYFNRKALPVGCSQFSIKEIRSISFNPKKWESIIFEMPCPYHIKDHTNTSEMAIERTIDNEDDGIVGIYEDVSDGRNKVGVVKYGSSYRILYISGSNNRCWETGHVKADLRPTATAGLYKGKWYMTDFSDNNSCMFTFDGMKMDIVVDDQKMMFIKMYPTQGSSSSVITNVEKWSGTGWALGSGCVVTNYHVVDGARKISVKGADGDLNTGYSAEVVATDKTNDIAVLKIKDSRFKEFGTIPYAVSSRIADKGEEIFVLGYPMTQVLGNEVKYTAGEINSRTGFQGDVATYQISAPVTHGNSGGPMFDSKGNVIGIVNSGITDKEIAENVGYAIKISFLKILIESAGLNITLPSNNTISTLSKQEKIKKVEKFVYYIECSK